MNERLAHRQFVTFLDNNNKVSQFQSGNRKYHSAETTPLSVTDDLLKAIDEKENLNIGVDGDVEGFW